MSIQNHPSQCSFCNEAQKPKPLVKCALTIYLKLFMFTAGINHLYIGSGVSTSIKIFSEEIKRLFKGASSSHTRKIISVF